MVWVVVHGDHFWYLKITCLPGLAREAQKRETGSIRSEGDLRDGSGGFWTVVLRIRDSVFSPEFMCFLTFLINVTFFW